jgi:hypothetical protein
MNFEQLGGQTERSSRAEIAERVTAHAEEFDAEIAANRWFSKEEVAEAWQVREWQIGETSVTAIGVSHVPETMVDYREEIERAIAESDIVVNEYAPEAIGMYSESAGDRLAAIPSNVNEELSLDDVREAYVKNERFWNNGQFQHEVELLAAKYGKDMAVADLSFPHDLEAFLQNNHLGTHGAEKIAQQEARLQQAGLLTGAAAASAVGIKAFLSELKKQKPMSRRAFLKGGLAAGVAAGAAVAGLNSDGPEQKAYRDGYEEDTQHDDQSNALRDPALAKALQQLSEQGYKKVAFIYGTLHLQEVEGYLNSPEMIDAAFEQNQEFLDKHHPDWFRIYRQVPGENDSEKFVADKNMVWDRVD